MSSLNVVAIVLFLFALVQCVADFHGQAQQQIEIIHPVKHRGLLQLIHLPAAGKVPAGEYKLIEFRQRRP